MTTAGRIDGTKSLATNIEKRFYATANEIKNPHQQPDNIQERLSKLMEKDNTLVNLPLSLIIVDKNIRHQMDEDSPAFVSLMETIKLHGVLQPPVVTVTLSDVNKYQLMCVAGHRRILAAKKVGLENLNCLVRKFDSKGIQIIASISENISRRDLDPLDLAQTFLELELEGYTRAQMEDLFDRDRKTIQRYLKMASWSESSKNLIRSKPDRFSRKFLLDIASRALTSEEIDNLILEQAGLSLKPKGNRHTKTKLIFEKFENYCEEKGISEKEKEIVIEVLKLLKVL
jgi:ParB/RepB/Spo0J family partition protein